MGKPDGSTYSLTYVASPKKTYVIQPQGGEINYDMAFKNPIKFYNNVMNQDIREHSAAEGKTRKSPLKYRNILTKRAIAQVLALIENKLCQLVKEQTMQKFKSNNEHIDEADVHEAFQDREIEHVMKKQLSDGGIKLLHKDSGSPVFVQETKLIAEKGKRAADEFFEGSIEGAHTNNLEDAEVVSF